MHIFHSQVLMTHVCVIKSFMFLYLPLMKYDKAKIYFIIIIDSEVFLSSLRILYDFIF